MTPPSEGDFNPFYQDPGPGPEPPCKNHTSASPAPGAVPHPHLQVATRTTAESPNQGPQGSQDPQLQPPVCTQRPLCIYCFLLSATDCYNQMLLCILLFL
ncbi:hypothetical protein GDO81_020012 [Engystomops pustulosus]|uniref:Uncharacterized protein n=1 Tax=Engystomops pustulosus TaxID=76066 RepID=A0AAV6ZAE8_ENGPU|nr:hypothetical protein GDO81_020012 [Engystomops pustulosus]